MRDRLYKRGDIWWCRIRGRTGRIERKSTHCRDYQAALTVAADLERSAASEDHATAEETPFERGVTDYFADLVRRGRSSATIAIAQQKTGHMLRLWGKSTPLARITARLVTEYIDARIEEGVSRFTVKKELGHLGQVLRLARYHRAYHLDVDQVIPPFFSGEHRPRTRWPTIEETRLLLAELEPRRAAHLAFIVATGARLSESLRARRSHVDWSRRVVHVAGTKTRGADAEVPITRLTEELLRWSLETAPGPDLLFHPWDKIHRDVAAACVRAGIARVSPNDLRRAFGHWHRAAGVPVDIVAKMLRHTTDKLAQTTYARIGGDQLSELVARALASVPVLYLGTASTDPKALSPHAPWTRTTGKNADFVGTPGLARTGALRFRKPTDDRRSRGTKLGLARAELARTVSNMYRDNLARCGFEAPPLTSDAWADVDAAEAARGVA